MNSKKLVFLSLYVACYLEAGGFLSLFRSKKFEPAEIVNKIQNCEQQATGILWLIAVTDKIMPSPAHGNYLRNFRAQFMDLQIERLNLCTQLLTNKCEPEEFGIYLSDLERETARANMARFFELHHETQLPYELQYIYLAQCRQILEYNPEQATPHKKEV